MPNGVASRRGESFPSQTFDGERRARLCCVPWAINLRKRHRNRHLKNRPRPIRPRKKRTRRRRRNPFQRPPVRSRPGPSLTACQEETSGAFPSGRGRIASKRPGVSGDERMAVVRNASARRSIVRSLMLGVVTAGLCNRHARLTSRDSPPDAVRRPFWMDASRKSADTRPNGLTQIEPARFVTASRQDGSRVFA